MMLPNVASLFRWVNNFFPGSQSQSQDFLQLARQSDGTVLGWIDETGTPRGSLAPPSPVTIPFFTNAPVIGDPGTSVAIGGETGFTLQGNIGGFAFYLPAQITTSGIFFNVAGTDSTNSYDIGIFGPFTKPLPNPPFTFPFGESDPPFPTELRLTMPLVCNTGPQQYTHVNTAAVSWLTPVTIPTGWYFLMFTTAGTSSLDLEIYGVASLGNEFLAPYLYGVGITQSADSTLPSSLETGILAYTYSDGSGQPMAIYFALY